MGYLIVMQVSCKESCVLRVWKCFLQAQESGDVLGASTWAVMFNAMELEGYGKGSTLTDSWSEKI